MGTYVQIHKPGERVFVMADNGRMLAYKVMANGEMKDMDIHAALEEEQDPDE